MKVAAKHVYMNSAELATFLGNFYMYAGIMTVLVQFSLVGFFLRQFGIISCLLLLPGFQAVMSLLFYASGHGFGAASTLFIITTTNLFRITLTESLDLPSRELLFLPLASHLRVRAQAMMGGIVEPVGLGIGGLLIIGFSSLMTPLFHYSLLVFSFACAWLLLLLWLQPRYRQMLSSSLKSTQLDGETFRELAQSHRIEPVLHEMLHHKEQRLIQLALKLLASRSRHDFPSTLLTLAGDSRPEIAAKAIELLGSSGHAKYLGLLEQKLHSSSSRIRKAAILAICRIEKERILPAIERWLISPDPITRYAALIGCGQYGGQEGRHLLRPGLKKLVTARQAGKRRLAASLLRDIGDPAYANFLEILLDDADLTVRVAAVKACAPLQSAILVSHLLRLYHSPELRVSIIEALEQSPEEYAPMIANASQDFQLDRSSRNLLFQVLGSIGGRVAQKQLWDTFSGHNPLSVRVAAGNALWRLALREPLQEISGTDIDEWLEELCRNIAELNHACAELPNSESVLQQLLHDQAHLEIECLFQLLSFSNDSRQLEKVQYNVFSSGPTQQANALELLDDILPRRLAPRIGELLDNFLQRKKFPASGVSPKSIQQLMRKEHWLEAVITYYHENNTPGRLSDRNPELFTHLEKIAFFKKIPLFQEVPANDLLPLAEIAETMYLGCGETLFSQGDRGDAMYLIRRGTIDILVQGVLVNQMYRGECIGEMAILDDTPRTASCIAGDETEVLKISAQHFHMLIKSQTSVALAVLQTLSKRLRRQTKQMLLAQRELWSSNGRSSRNSAKTRKTPFRSKPVIDVGAEDEKQALCHLLRKVAFVKDSPLCKEIAEDYFIPLARMARLEVFKKGETIFHQGDSGDAFYCICQGSVSVQIDGVEVSRLHDGNCFGEMAILDALPRSASCLAIDESELLTFSETDFELLLKSQTRVSLRMLTMLARKLRHQTRNSIQHKRQAAPAR